MNDFPEDPILKTTVAQIAAVVIHVTCPCGDDLVIEIDCEQDDSGAWSAPLDERFVCCETCGTLLDAGLQITVQDPE
jgi:hypothetical protein